MKIEKIDSVGSCKMHKCTNEANTIVDFERKGLPLKIRVCDKCLAEFYKDLSRQFIPKSPKNIIRKGESKN